MTPAKLALDPATSTHFTSSDGRLEVAVPAGSTTAAELAVPGGRAQLSITEIAPPSGSVAGGSGVFSLGTYLFKALDSSGAPSTGALSTPVQLTLHYGLQDAAFGLNRVVAILDGTVPFGSRTDQPASRTQAAQLDSTAGTLSTSATMTSSTMSTSFGGDSPVAVFGKPDPFEADLSSGAVTTSYPIDLPPGPGGFTPPLRFAYSSANVNDQHSVQGAAPWVGEGWNASLGSISWNEHDVHANCVSPCQSLWEDSWQMTDPFGTSADLIPPTADTTTYYDDTIYPQTPSPIIWHMAPESHAKIVSYTGTISLPGMTRTPVCFRAFLPSGVMEEFGCTQDSLQYYPALNVNGSYYDYISSWLLDLITDPQGNQIHITYQRDMETSSNILYPRDAVLSTVEYDSPGCLDAQTICSYPMWAPLLRVSFVASHDVAHIQGSSCASSANLRCDDPADMTGGLPAPLVQSTFVLNDVQVQVRASGGATWTNTLRDYQLTYYQYPAGFYNDPASGSSMMTAGTLLLMQLVEIGDDSTTMAPTKHFNYSYIQEFDEDNFFSPAAGAGCGPSFNTSCRLWAQSLGGNSYYLTSVINGIGANDTFSYQLARDNMHGVNGGGANTANTFYCNTPSITGTYPCSLADDRTWSRVVVATSTNTVLRLSQAGQGGTQTTTTTPVNGTTSYAYNVSYPLVAQQCSDCVAAYSWGSQNDNDYLGYYNGSFFGFAQATVTKPDGGVDLHKYYSTEGWGVYDTTQITCSTNPPNPCHNDPFWDLANVAHAHEIELDQYAPSSGPLLRKVATQYQATCPPAGVAGTPPIPGLTGSNDGMLVAELDHSNPVAVCDVQMSRIDTTTYDGATSGALPDRTETFAYDSYGRQTSHTTSSNDGGVNGSPSTIVHKSTYVWNDAVTATSTSATGSYLINFPSMTDTENSSGTQYGCIYSSYDGMANVSGQNSGLMLGQLTRSDQCATASVRNSTTYGYDSFGNPVTSDDPDANSGQGSHLGCSRSGTNFSSCSVWDGTFDTLPLSTTNALNQTASTGYANPVGATASTGFGLWPMSTTDVNGQVTNFTYDALGRQTSTTLPGETSGLTTTGTTYTIWCSSSGPRTPCAEIDSTQRLNGTTTVTQRAFYDGNGNLVETRTHAPGSADVVQYAFYDPSQRRVFLSVKYLVAAYTGGPGAAAFSIPDTTVAGTSIAYDTLGRPTSTTDALSHATNLQFSVVCGTISGDSGCYEQTLSQDPLGHQKGTLVDALGRETYAQLYTGNQSSNWAVYATSKYGYDYLGDQALIVQPNGTSQTTFQYDMAGRRTGMTDPDRGSETYFYDADGNLTESVDARGSTGTTFAGYDGLDRPLWRNTSNTPTGAYATTTYDNTAGGNFGVGRLTGEAFAGGTTGIPLSGSYAYTYDDRGRTLQSTLTVEGGSYPVASTYDDAGNTLTTGYPNGDLVTNLLSSQGWLSGVDLLPQGGTTTHLVSGAGYTGNGGAVGLITGASWGTGLTYSATYDLLVRPTLLQVSPAGGGNALFSQVPAYDAAGNVTSSIAALNGGTDTQAFCYDDMNRLTWAGASGTPPCSGRPTPSTTLSGAGYSQTYAYDNLGRLTSGQAGAYTYLKTPLHGATAIGSGYRATYDARGDMLCRAPTSATTCSGPSPTGALMTYNNEGALNGWSQSGTSDAFLYHNGTDRIEQKTGATTSNITLYVGSLEELILNNDHTVVNTRAFYYANGARVATSNNGTISYIASDLLGSTSETFNSTGAISGAQLAKPYGQSRYVSGTIPTDYRFAGQHLDATTGLDYFNARYYDSIAGQFISADTVVPGGGADILGLSRFAYVEGNPETASDPSGHCSTEACLENLNGGPTGTPVTYMPDPTSTATNTAAAAPSHYNVWAALTALGRGIASLRPTENDDRAFDSSATPGAYLAMADSRELSNPDDWGSTHAFQVAADNAKIGFLIAATYVTGRLAGTVFGGSAASSTAAGGADSGLPADLVRPPSPYARPSGATTAAQRAAVQGQPCVACGAITETQVADHISPLVQEWYDTGTIDTTGMRSVSAVQPQCPTCSAAQGGQMSWYSRYMRDLVFGNDEP
jgi:RHS repeat-associated protein